MIIFREVGARALRCPEILLSEGFLCVGYDFIRSKAEKLEKSEKQALDSEGECGVVDEVLVKAQNSSSVSLTAATFSHRRRLWSSSCM